MTVFKIINKESMTMWLRCVAKLNTRLGLSDFATCCQSVNNLLLMTLFVVTPNGNVHLSEDVIVSHTAPIDGSVEETAVRLPTLCFIASLIQLIGIALFYYNLHVRAYEHVATLKLTKFMTVNVCHSRLTNQT